MKFAKVIETIFLFDRNESNVAARDNHTAGTAMQSTSQKAAHGEIIFPVHRPRFWEMLRFFHSGWESRCLWKRPARGWDDELGREWTLCGQTRLHIGANGSTMGEKTTPDKIYNPLCGHLPSYSKMRWLTFAAQVPAQVSRHISASHRVLHAYESLEVSWQKLSFEIVIQDA